MDQLGGHKGTKKALVLIILLVFAGLAAAQDVACPLGGYIDEATGACSYGITINIAYPDWLTESEAASTAVGTLINDIQTGFLGDLSMMVGPYFNGAYLDVSYQEFEHGAPLRSIVFTISTYTGGAHGNVFFDSVTVDTFANRALSLADDIFVPGADVIATLQPLVVAQLVEQQAEFADLEWINSGTDGLDDYLAWAINAGTLELFFPPYQVAAYAAGSFQVSIPVDDLAAVINPMLLP